MKKIINNRITGILCAVLCSAGAALLAYSFFMLFFSTKSDYHGMTYTEMLQQGNRRMNEQIIGETLSRMSMPPISDTEQTYADEVTENYEALCEYWKTEGAALEEKCNWLDFAILVSEQRETASLKDPVYLYKSSGFTDYTDQMQLQAFAESYNCEYDSYSVLISDAYPYHWNIHTEDLPLEKPCYLTIFFKYRNAEDVSKTILSDKQQEFIRALYQADRYSGLLPVLAVTLIIGVLLFCRCAGHRAGHDEVKQGFADRIPFLFWLITVVTMEDVILVGCSEFLVNSRTIGMLSFKEYTGVFCGAIFSAALICFAFLNTVCVRIKTKSFLKTTLLWWCFSNIKAASIKIGNWAVTHLPLAARMFILLPVLAVISLVEAALIQDTGTFFVLLFILARLFSIAVIVYLFWGYSRLRDGAAALASGKQSGPISEAYLTPDFRMFANDLNNVGESIQFAVEERMKSERLKTQLITNVSHDIKTPLTSIINYVDLLQKNEATEEEKEEYLEVLAHQSDRLKKLIQDLIDASKASSGAMEVELSDINLNTFIKQVTGEYQDKLDAAGLSIVSREKKNDINVSADSNLLWRVLDNLFVNILKYAMPGTRVYTDITEENGTVTLSISNISKAELGISGDELMERFVRGDASRNTEGSGLGLSIAQSLTQLMGGDLIISVDGDMFKAVLKLQTAK